MSAEAYFQVAAKDLRYRDTWRLSSIRVTALHAYKRLEQRGDIAISYPVMLYKRRGHLVIWYDANMPHEWTLETLRAEELRVIQEAKAERDTLEAELNRLSLVVDETTLPDFARMAKRYMELQRMLGGDSL